VTEHGTPMSVEFEATEKLYADYQVPGGHSTLPKPDNAICHVADALAALQKFQFPFELNSVTRGGHAFNALPQRAEVNVNCRIFPGHSQEEIRLELERVFNDPTLTVRYRSDSGALLDHGSDRTAMKVPALRPDVMDSLHRVSAKLWPGTMVAPIMENRRIGQHLHHVGGHPQLWHQRRRDRS
jgi:acetylornithine deacetylase/succinyl-diaminopimelate desuccinylase-like protein